jgi:hypothetical protein
VCDARVAEGADPAVQRLRHLEPQIVGTRRHAATSRGHEAAESAHLVPWTPTLSKHGERRRTKRGAVSINRELVTAAMSAPSPAAGVGEDLVAGTGNTPPAPAIATGSRGRSADHRRVNLRCCARMAGQRRASRATWRHRRCLSTDPFSDHDVPAAPPRPRKLSATSDECPVAALILTSFSRSSGRFAVVGSLTGPR